MNITVKGIVKTAVIGTLAYGAGKLATLAKLVQVAKDRPDDLRECTEVLCGMWQTLKEQTETEGDNEEAEEQPAPEIVQVTNAAEEETPEENQPED